jgi:dihydrofolate reductase
MRRLAVFNNVSLDGFIADAAGDMGWAHRDDEEWSEFVRGNAAGDSELLFGRITYELMASYWPTPMARRNDPDVAARMNAAAKVVFSRTLARVAWENTRLVRSDMVGEVARMKAASGPDLVILGSGQIVAQLADAGLVDRLQLAVHPIVLGAGKPALAVRRRLDLRRTDVRPFANGVVVLSYQRA